MFNLEDASKRKVFWLTVLHWVLYSAFCVIAPCVTIMIKYGMIGEKVTFISGIGISILVIFLFIGLKLLKNQANRIPVDSYLWKARVKAILNLIFSLTVPVVVLFLVFLIKDNMALAISCIEICVWFILIGFVEDCVLGSSVERENMIMNNSKADKEKAKRSNKV